MTTAQKKTTDLKAVEEEDSDPATDHKNSEEPSKDDNYKETKDKNDDMVCFPTKRHHMFATRQTGNPK